jgi:hypothetical protein
MGCLVGQAPGAAAVWAKVLTLALPRHSSAANSEVALSCRFVFVIIVNVSR